MEWNVYICNVNKQKIETYNIFQHWSFREYSQKAAKKYKTKEEFVDQLKRELRYYFWSKSEWELVIEITEYNRIFLNPWVGCRKPEKVRIDVTDYTSFDWIGFAEKHTKRQTYGNKAKIDVFDQVDYVWDDFVGYVWDNRKELLKENIETVGYADQSGLAPAT